MGGVGGHNEEFGQCKQQKSRLDLHASVSENTQCNNYHGQKLDSLGLIVTQLHTWILTKLSNTLNSETHSRVIVITITEDCLTQSPEVSLPSVYCKCVTF